jgi:glyoxylase-like metal-dependent hydrolase (beta-lactamase superfamily II)
MALSYDVVVSPPVAQAAAEPLPGGGPRMWSPISSTLITGAREAVLVDPPLTIGQTAALGDRIEATGLRLTHIYVTHGHGDHWFGCEPLVRRFPGVTVYATAGTIAAMRRQGDARTRATFWEPRFPGQLPPSPVLARPVPAGGFELAGEALVAVEVGHSDSDDTTVLHVPSIGLVVAGDVVYNGVHQYLAESAGGGLDKWLAALELVEGLAPRRVVAGHKDPARDDDPAAVAETGRYLRDAAGLLASCATAREFYDAMLARYPDRCNPGAVWTSATSLLPS